MPFATLDGQPLHYLDQGQGPVVFLAGSYLWDTGMWAPQIEALSARYRVIAVDLSTRKEYLLDYKHVPSAWALLMWIRLEATTRRPASSNLAAILPVRLRRVASGLMIEKVRSVMGIDFLLGRMRSRAYSDAPPPRQAVFQQAMARMWPAAA